jgi:uncharacterized protein YecE (DUF72 family)
MRLHVGTSGFSYREWKGAFYPEGVGDRELLAFYARRLDAVEINNTFHRFPTAAGLAAWAAQVPARFRFALKVPQRITHQKRLRNAGDDLDYLLGTLAGLGPHRGPLLFQCPPRMPLDLDALTDLTGQLPPGQPAAFEFRDPRWHCDAVYRLLEAQGCALCFNDASMAAPRPTADWGYVRLRRDGYSDEGLRAAAAAVLAQPWREVYVFVKHEAPDVPVVAGRWRELATELAAARGAWAPSPPPPSESGPSPDPGS